MSPHTHLSRVLLILSVLFFSAIFITNIAFNGEQQFVSLAQSFLQGKMYFLSEPGSWWDTVLYNGQYYWPLGPFPAIALLPFVFIANLLQLPFYQGYLNMALVGGILLTIAAIARKLKYSSNDSWFWGYAFCFATVLFGVAFIPFSWWFSQVLTVFLLFLTFWEYQRKRRYQVIGILLACILATRTTAALAVVFYIADIFISKKSAKKLENLIWLLMPLVISALLIAFYNYARFGSFSEQGYSQQILIEPLTRAREYGLLNIRHIPGNLYYFLLGMPQTVLKDSVSQVLQFPYVKANPWGMSVFVTSPILIYLFFIKKLDVISKALLVTAGVVALPVFLYYGIGYRQFGYRYALDFLPILFFVLMREYRSISKTLTLRTKWLIIISSCINLYLFLTFLAFW